MDYHTPMNLKEPPIGITPRRILEEQFEKERIHEILAAARRLAEEQFEKERIREILAAMFRFADEKVPAPREWVTELNERLVKRGVL